MTEEHIVSAIPEIRRPTTGESKPVTRYRGRCSCGATTYQHYLTPDLAKSALRRTHLTEGADA